MGSLVREPWRLKHLRPCWAFESLEAASESQCEASDAGIVLAWGAWHRRAATILGLRPRWAISERGFLRSGRVRHILVLRTIGQVDSCLIGAMGAHVEAILSEQTSKGSGRESNYVEH